MIEIIYTGQKGFYDVTRSNHNILLDKINEIDNLKVNWFTKPNPLRGECPFDNTEGRGAIQVWDLLDALEKIENNIFLKLRTDLWFTQDSINVILSELTEIINKKQEISFIGWMYKDWDFDLPYNKISTEGQSRLQDFVIIGDKTKLAKKEIIIERLHNRPMSKSISGNKTFGDIIDDRSKAFTIKTHMYICRKNYESVSERELAVDYFDAYAKGKANEYKLWYLKNREKNA